MAELGRILLFGANGQVGRALQAALADEELLPLDRSAADLRDPGALADLVRRHRPRVVINAAAYTAVDRAESEPDLAHAVNATAMEAIATEARAVGAMLVYYSSDYVYDGAKSTPYVETDATNPLSVYGRTKLAGERAAAACPRHIVLRTSWVVSAHGTNFLKTMLQLGAEREELRVVADQHGAPATASLLASVTATIVRAMNDTGPEDPRWSVYHVTSSGETTWNELARYVIGRAREVGLQVRATPVSVAAIATTEYPTPAMRPHNSRLDTTKLRTTFGVELPGWRQAIDDVLLELAASSLRPSLS
jgi:dTDP-4-dehydrorhamnose reductase